MRDFRKLRIYELGVDLAVEAYRLAQKLPKSEMFGLQSQITRAAISVVANIAEGCGRSGTLENARFLEISLGSLYELEAHFVLTLRLKFISKEDVASILQTVLREQKMVSSFILKLRSWALTRG